VLSFLYTADLSLGLTIPSNTGHNLTQRRLDYYASSQSVCWESTVSGPCEHQALFSLILLDVFRPQLWLFSSHACADLCSAKSSKETLCEAPGFFFFFCAAFSSLTQMMIVWKNGHGKQEENGFVKL